MNKVSAYQLSTLFTCRYWLQVNKNDFKLLIIYHHHKYIDFAVKFLVFGEYFIPKVNALFYFDNHLLNTECRACGIMVIAYDYEL